MAANPRSGYYATAPDHHAKHSHFEADSEAGVLDPAILDADIMQSPSSAHFGRKDSFASNGVLTPTEPHGWEHQIHNLPIDAATGGPIPYHDDHRPFIRPGPPHAHPAYAPQPHPSWPLDHASGALTPPNGMDFMPQAAPSYDAHFVHPHVDASRGSFSHGPVPVPAQAAAFNGPQVDQAFAPQVQAPMSPHSHADWMRLAEDESRSRPMQKRMRPNSPPMTMVDFARRDGIRKKNGRIDIPPERNIHTIDELIDQTTDEDLLKELKQQKRLLRNREAALASRQRKKKHTEDLEHKEKGYSHEIQRLEANVSALQIENQHQEEQRQLLLQRFQESQRVIESLQEDIRNLKLQHNEETSSLRHKLLQAEQQDFETCQAPAMSAAPSSTGLGDFAEQMGSLNVGAHDMGNQEWSLIGYPEFATSDLDEFSWDPPAPMQAVEKQSSSTMVATPSKKSGNADQPIASGLLFMLLLCGAYVASRPSKMQPAGVPEMPLEVRNAAPAVLQNLLAEGGSAPNAASITFQTGLHEPQPSGMPYGPARGNSRLDQLHKHVTTPTKQQQLDQAAQLTTAQYASISNMNMESYDGNSRGQNRPVSGQRRNMAETLANLQRDRDSQQTSKAEVYTRSLLWNQIPEDVVQQFKQMVRDHEDIEKRQQQMQNGLKHEA
ncbi:hypothetical protein EJ03DRAFT_183319 [Teratosphaeria nubilosa]|uniref:BZIP domain-containing protein n=1 Tax=Teratosphaeria nubilosa TaxID=161662 RepID=A0A6G1L115_9PEZI|nr:hypothetical protein EJ03DRAFT_183319 [Teratosphaeria nubilosa]